MLTRRDFLWTASLPLLASCGGGTDSAPDAPGPPDAPFPLDAGPPDAPPGPDGVPVSCVDNGTIISISDPHGHVLMVTKEDVIAGVAKMYDITGTADHPHLVSLSASHFAELMAGTTVVVFSSYDLSHDHVVTVACAPA